MKKISSKKKTNIYYKSKSKRIHMHSKLFISWKKKVKNILFNNYISKNHFLYNQVHNSSIRELRKLIGWNEYTCIEYSLQLNVLIDSVDITIHRIYIRINCKCNIFFKKFNFILVSPRINYCISIRGKAFHSS